HFLRRAIASVNGDQFRGKNESEIAIWNECARLLANAIFKEINVNKAG
ncbi:MAG: transposase, partial [Alteromonas sp.]|nr:transposase [Alteromonas sp.]